MEKVIKLECTRYEFEPYDDSKNYEDRMAVPMANKPHSVETVREIVCDLVIQGKLDKIDLKIIAARDCSPMPSMREVARQLHLTHPTILKRVTTIRRLLSIQLH
jgi:hypothetical protein